MAALTLRVNDMSVASPTWQVNGRRSMAALTRRLKGGVWRGGCYDLVGNWRYHMCSNPEVTAALTWWVIGSITLL